MARKHDPSDLTDGQWHYIKRFVPKPARHGRKPIDRSMRNHQRHSRSPALRPADGLSLASLAPRFPPWENRPQHIPAMGDPWRLTGWPRWIARIGAKSGGFKGFGDPPETLDCETAFRLAGTLASAQQRLRTESRDQQSHDPNQHDCPHVATPRSHEKIISGHALGAGELARITAANLNLNASPRR